MSKKMMKIPSLLKMKSSKKHDHDPYWQWPSCKHPKTLSFRARNPDSDYVFKTLNSIFLDPGPSDQGSVQTPDSWFTTTTSSDCTSCANFSDHSDNDVLMVNTIKNNIVNEVVDEDASEFSVETIIRGVRSSTDRLFFEPEVTSSILVKEEACVNINNDNDDEDCAPFKESVALAMESEDPYSDFKRSMEEMVESHGLKDWECLEELLGWYLRMNRKMNHRIIVGAFVDLLIELANSDDNDTKSYHKNTITDHLHRRHTNKKPTTTVMMSCTTSSDSTTASYSSADSSFSEEELGNEIDENHVGEAHEDDDVIVLH